MPCMRNNAASGRGQLILVLHGLGSLNFHAQRVIRGQGRGGKTPGIEDGIAHIIRYLPVILESAGLHGEVFSAGADVLRRRRAGDDLELIDSVHVHGQGDQPVVTLLGDGLCRHALYIELAKIASGTTYDGHAPAVIG